MKMISERHSYQETVEWPVELQGCRPFDSKLDGWKSVQVERIKRDAYQAGVDLISIADFDAIQSELKNNPDPLPEKTGNVMDDMQGIISSTWHQTGSTKFKIQYWLQKGPVQPLDKARIERDRLNAIQRIKGDF